MIRIKHNAVVVLILMSSMALSCASNKDYLVTIKTSYGEIKLVLFDDTPLHKSNFIELASAGRYDGTSFYRVIKEFMIQGGDVNTKEGTTTSEEAMIPEEIKAHHIHVRGAVAAARTNNPQRKSSECQFYIVQGKKWTEQELTLDQVRLNQYLAQLLARPEFQELKEELVQIQQTGDLKAIQDKLNDMQPVIENEFEVSLSKDFPEDRLKIYTTEGGAPHLDDEYTVFGQVVSGMDVVDAIADQSTDEMDKPLEEIPMEVEVKKMKRSKITKLYGYQFPQ